MDNIMTSRPPGYIAFVAAVVVALALYGCGKGPADAPVPEKMAPVTPVPGEVQSKDVVVKEPPKQNVKLRRNKDNTYSWEISGEDVDGVIRADRRLSKALDSQPAGVQGKPGRSYEKDDAE